jgi:hypothetical protein
MDNIEDAKRNERLDIDRQYEAGRNVRNRGVGDVKVDPWASVRSAEQPAKKSAKGKKTTTAH